MLTRHADTRPPAPTPQQRRIAQSIGRNVDQIARVEAEEIRARHVIGLGSLHSSATDAAYITVRALSDVRRRDARLARKPMVDRSHDFMGNAPRSSRLRDRTPT